jgi:DNA-binding MarR family transcriptional regulator
LTDPNDTIEQQLFILLRRTNSIHMSTSSGEMELERSSYGILCLLLDEGPQRLGSIATAFRLDPSTVTRQVQTVVQLGLAEKATDPGDRRATVLSLSDRGREAVQETRAYRRRMLEAILNDWSVEDRELFGAYLARFNGTIDAWDAGAVPLPE